MRREDLIVAALCLVTSVVILVESVPRYFTERGALGSGAYPCFIAFLLTVCGVSILVQWVRGHRERNAPPFFPRGRGGKLLACTAGSLVAHRVGTDLLGFGLASLLLMIFQMRILGRHRWWTILGLSGLFIALVSYTFREWLYMDLPRGFLGF
jgi:putative tricarboxylic transport membrane protein